MYMYSKRKKIHQFIVNIFLVAPEKGKRNYQKRNRVLLVRAERNR